MRPPLANRQTRPEYASASETLHHLVGKIARTRVWQITWRALREFSDDRIPSVAAGITFFILLALVPGVACVVSIYGLFADRAAIADELQRLSGFLPGGATAVLQEQLSRLTAQPSQKLGIGLVAGLIVAIWSASGGVKALIEGLDVAYEVRETRNFLRLTIHALLFTSAAVVSVAGAIAVDNLVPLLLGRMRIGDSLDIMLGVLAWPAAFVVCAVLASIVYRYGPNRAGSEWHWITYGSATASALWMAGTALFTWYVRNFGHYDRIYGDLGSLVGFLTWIWFSTLILLLGAEINHEIERSRPPGERAESPHN